MAKSSLEKPLQMLDSLHVDEVALVQMFQRKRCQEALFTAEKGVRTGHLVHMFGKPKMARMRLSHAKTRLSAGRVVDDRKCFDETRG